MSKPRDYQHEYLTYHAKAGQKKDRAQRNSARTEMAKAGKVAKGDGKEVDHKKPIRSGGSNAPSNLRVSTQQANRGWRGKK
jgi:5-methylcytosine-specific restriction endonuclease McrA